LAVGFEPNKVIDPVAGGDARHRLTLVLPDASHEIGSYPDIQSPVRFTGEQIDVKHALGFCDLSHNLCRPGGSREPSLRFASLLLEPLMVQRIAEARACGTMGPGFRRDDDYRIHAGCRFHSTIAKVRCQ